MSKTKVWQNFSDKIFISEKISNSPSFLFKSICRIVCWRSKPGLCGEFLTHVGSERLKEKIFLMLQSFGMLAHLFVTIPRPWDQNVSTAKFFSLFKVKCKKLGFIAPLISSVALALCHGEGHRYKARYKPRLLIWREDTWLFNKEPSIKYVYSLGGGFFTCGRIPTFWCKNLEFSKFMVCPQGQGGGGGDWASADKGEGQFFEILCVPHLWTVPYCNVALFVLLPNYFVRQTIAKIAIWINQIQHYRWNKPWTIMGR